MFIFSLVLLYNLYSFVSLSFFFLLYFLELEYIYIYTLEYIHTNCNLFIYYRVFELTRDFREVHTLAIKQLPLITIITYWQRDTLLS